MLGTGSTVSNCSTAYEYWSNGHYCEKLLEFFEPWQNYLYDASPSRTLPRPRVGGYRLIIGFNDEADSPTNMYPAIDDNVFLSGGVTFNQNEPDIQKVRLQLTFAIGNMKPTEVYIPTYSIEYYGGTNDSYLFTQEFPIISNPILAASDGEGYVGGKGYLKGWKDLTTGLNYRKGSVAPSLKEGISPGDTIELHGIYSTPQCTCIFGRDGIFEAYGVSLMDVGDHVYLCNPTAGMSSSQLNDYDDPDSDSYYITYNVPIVSGNSPYDVEVWMIGGGGGGQFGPATKTTFRMGRIYSGGGGGSGYVLNTTRSYITRSGGEQLTVHVGKGGGCAEAYKGFWGIQFYEDRCSDGAKSVLMIKTLADGGDICEALGGKAGNTPIGEMWEGSSGASERYWSKQPGVGGAGQGSGGTGGYTTYGSGPTELGAGGDGENSGSGNKLVINGHTIGYDYAYWGKSSGENGTDIAGSAGGGSTSIRDSFAMNSTYMLIAKGGNGITSETHWPDNEDNANSNPPSVVNGIHGGGGGGGTPYVDRVTHWGGDPISDGFFDSGVTIGAGYGGGGVVAVRFFKNDGVNYVN